MSETTSRATRTAAAQVLAWASRESFAMGKKNAAKSRLQHQHQRRFHESLCLDDAVMANATSGAAPDFRDSWAEGLRRSCPPDPQQLKKCAWGIGSEKAMSESRVGAFAFAAGGSRKSQGEMSHDQGADFGSHISWRMGRGEESCSNDCLRVCRLVSGVPWTLHVWDIRLCP
ncbi:unnamed protein product [Symbiodinium sp. CCMP2592]|nr:unnamed protein product [Symbiodinium sp. CCMP2592]